jgi:DNA-binding GntR family transcriptional regulator
VGGSALRHPDVALPPLSAQDVDALHASGPGLPPLRERVRDLLRDWIIHGRFPPGLRLYEQDLATALCISRLPVREAIRMLEAEGYLLVAARRVCVRQVGRAAAAKLFDVRECMESLATRLSARQITPSGVRVLARLLEEGRAALDSNDLAAIARANVAFHEEVSHLADNDVLEGVLGPLRGRMQWLLRENREPLRIWQEHLAIFDAIAAGDAERAAAAAQQHIFATRCEVLPHLRA